MRLLATLGRSNHVIGGADIVPWNIPDVRGQIFNEIDDQIVVIGRRSWELFGQDLPCFQAVVLSRGHTDSTLASDSALVVPDLPLALSMAAEIDADRKVLVVGGASVFRQALPLAQGMILAMMKNPLPGDLSFPDFSDQEWWIEDMFEHPSYELLRYARRNIA